ncbi:MAG TPA: peptidoglycan DD-metalloendopeptidase family protein [Solirubrobacteraceae bacterium]|nr:peptidoglycan DD-metalloendopeptidase family protein [Solirubrobacteraceae bacterium]
MRFRIAAFALLALAPLVLFASAPLGSSGRSLQSKIDSAQHRVDRASNRESVLSTDVAAASNRINVLQNDITVLRRRQQLLQRNLDVKRAELNRLQDQLRVARARLAQLQARFAMSRRVLAVRLSEIYKADRPDALTVVLNSKGFADLLERSEFIERINDQDTRIIRTVRIARDAAQVASDRLARLESRQQSITTQVLIRRNEVASVRIRLAARRHEYARARAAKAAALEKVRAEKQDAQEDLSALEREQARIRGVLGGGQQIDGPIRRGSGQFIWPVNGPITSPFCERRSWESCHPGIDIGVGSGTAIHAAASGVVAMAGPAGGYGNYTCIQHGGGISTCYGHQSSIQVSVGQHVRQGQVIGLSGCTGLCFGAHLHFEVRANGGVVNPLNYL